MPRELGWVIAVAGFESVKADGVTDAIKIEGFGALHPCAGLNGQLLTASQSRAALSGAIVDPVCSSACWLL